MTEETGKLLTFPIQTLSKRCVLVTPDGDLASDTGRKKLILRAQGVDFLHVDFEAQTVAICDEKGNRLFWADFSGPDTNRIEVRNQDEDLYLLAVEAFEAFSTALRRGLWKYQHE